MELLKCKLILFKLHCRSLKLHFLVEEITKKTTKKNNSQCLKKSETFRCINKNNQKLQKRPAHYGKKTNARGNKSVLLRNSKCSGHNMTFSSSMLWLEHWLFFNFVVAFSATFWLLLVKIRLQLYGGIKSSDIYRGYMVLYFEAKQ